VFDSSTIGRKRLVYAKALVDISLLKSLPSSITVRIADGVDAEVIVRYNWKQIYVLLVTLLVI